MKLVVRLSLAGLALLVAGCQVTEEPPAPATPVAAPAPPPPPPFRFIIYGDCRSRPEKHRLVVQQMLLSRPELVIQTGDLVGQGKDEGEWQQAYAIIAPLRQLGPYYMAIGNHDRGRPQVAQELNLPTEGDRLYYTWATRGCRFIVLNSNTIRLAGEDEEQVAWFQQTLAAATEPLIFVVLHHPLYAIGEYAPGDLEVRRRLLPILKSRPLVGVFSAHDHGYYRTTRDGIRFIVTAGGGAPMYRQDAAKAIAGDVLKSTLNFVEVTVQGTTASLRALDEQGGLVDELSVTAPPPAPAAPAPVPAGPAPAGG